MGLFIRETEKFESTLANLRKGRKVVFTNGVFDLLHVGHIRYLQEARALGDMLVVGLNADASVQRIKGPTRPLQSEDERMEILAALACVDLTTLFGADTPEQLIQRVRPDVLVKGGDWPVEKIVGAQYVMSYGGEVRTLQFVDGRSSTRLIDKMNSSN